MAKHIIRRAGKFVFIALNVLIGLLFIVGCYGYLFDPQSFWFVGVLTLGSLYFFLLLILYLFFWLFAKPRLMLISTVAILLCLKPLGQLLSFNFTANFPTERAEGQLRVMSWNIEHFEILEHKTQPELKEEMLQTISDYNPDIACFQEMVGSDEHKDAINYVPTIAERLRLPYYFYAYNKKLDFDSKHHFGIIIMSKYPIIAEHKMSYAPNDYNSIFQYVDILKGNDTIRVFNTHLQSLKFDKANMDYLAEPTLEEGENIKKSLGLLSKFKIGFVKRKWQSDRIHEAVAKSPFPTIVCGDFNDGPNSYAYNTIGKGLTNAFAEKGRGIGRTFYNISPTLRIDNIFVSDVLSVKNYTRVKKKMSDHFPIIADIEITGE